MIYFSLGPSTAFNDFDFEECNTGWIVAPYKLI